MLQKVCCSRNPLSSDAVALYELIKNGIDAGSEKIEINIEVVLQPSIFRSLKSKYVRYRDSEWTMEGFLRDLEDNLDVESTDEQRSDFLSTIGKPSSLASAIEQLELAFFTHNFINVKDWGQGMSLAELESCYLTIGTPARLHERNRLHSKSVSEGERNASRVPLGEKGIGRLAAMRLGHYVEVNTGTDVDSVWSQLILDWRPVFDDPDLDASALDFTPTKTIRDKKRLESGTTITVRALESDWTNGKLAELGQTEFSKLKDPFKDDYANQFLKINWQRKSIEDIVSFHSKLLKYADAKCSIKYRVGNGDIDDSDLGPRFEVVLSYQTFKSEQTLIHDGAHLQNCVSFEPRGKRKPKPEDNLVGSDEVRAALPFVGDFDAEFYWFNRGRFMREQNELWESKLKSFVRRWSGGLLVYRDGFRVYPYGSASDDWLDLDRKALSSGAYKLNRAQIVGYLRISSRTNPKLQDQTNREGFRDGPEKEALRRLLRQAIISDCKTFLNTVDKENRPADEETIKNLQQRIDQNQRAATNSLKQLKLRVPEEAATVNKVIAQLHEVEEAWGRAKQALAAHKEEVEQYIHLAGVGLMVELIAHELARTTQSALELLAKKNLATSPGQLAALEAQIKTLNKRVRILDDLSIPGRQIKLVHDMADLVDLVIELYTARAERDGVDIILKKIGKGKIKHRVEKGQILQILDNLFSNAMYWLARRVERKERAKITVELDFEGREIRVIDNGPGVPVTTGERVFDAFYTTKPSGDGRGLGLYIARRLAEENAADLDLIDSDDRSHHGFTLKFNES